MASSFISYTQGMLAVGLFVDIDPIEDLTQGRKGLLKGGGPYVLGVQVFACVCITAWSAIISFILLLVSNNKVVEIS